MLPAIDRSMWREHAKMARVNKLILEWVTQLPPLDARGPLWILSVPCLTSLSMLNKKEKKLAKGESDSPMKGSVGIRSTHFVNMLDGSLMDMVFTTLGVLLSMAMLSCICCMCMKFSDLKLKSYVVEMAKKRGFKVDLDKPEPKYKPCQSPQLNENCTIMIPDVAIVL